MPAEVTEAKAAPDEAMILFEVALNAREISPELLSKMEIRASYEEEANATGEGVTGYWRLDVPNSVPQDVLKPILNHLVSISVAALPAAEIPSAPASPQPTASH